MRKRIPIIAGAIALAGGAAVAIAKARGIHIVPNTKGGPVTIRTIRDSEGTPVRVMKSGGAYQSATYLDPDRVFEPAFAYYRAFDRMFDAALPIKRVLMLGGGGYAYPKHLLSTREDVSMTVVEIDPAVTDAARKFFFLDELIERYRLHETGRLELVCDDAARYLVTVPDHSYDAIVNDVFDGPAPAVSLLSANGLAEAKRILVPGGLYLLNAVVETGDMEMLGTFMEVLAEEFVNVWALDAADERIAGEDNYLLIASDANYAFSGAVGLLSRASSEAAEE